ncbi:hypothetical protein [Nocardia sp. NPDC059195]|uniref:hypothetical protein n=1 Tax=Nocardia sp. NPDC059195 TaxID=3346765 RepID=UPI0036C40ADC
MTACRPARHNPVDLFDAAGVKADQQARATNLIRSTLDGLPAFADVNSVGALGFRSIGDSPTGYEHYINMSYIRDNNFLDPAHPESLVYRVDGPTAPSSRRCTSPTARRSTTLPWWTSAGP